MTDTLQTGMTTDQLAEFGGEVVPQGLYQAKASKIDPKQKEDGASAYVELTYVITKDLREEKDGDAEGLTISKLLFPTVSKWKDGRYGSRGLSEAKAAIAAVGGKMVLPLDEFAIPNPEKPGKYMTSMKGARQLTKALVDAFRGKEFTVQVIGEKVQKYSELAGKWVDDIDESTGKVKVRHTPIVLGLVKGAAADGQDEPSLDDAQSVL